MKLLLTLLGMTVLCPAQWVMTTFTNPAIRAIAPEVHAIRSDDCCIYVESAGLSLHGFGPLEANQYDAPLGPRSLSFKIPRRPKPAAEHISTPLGIVGVFVTGVPIYNPIGTVSYQDQNIWHQDAVAAASSKTSALFTALTSPANRHSPIIGFALDGFPIYGPFGWDADGNVQRMKSSYGLRSFSTRTKLPDGTSLTPSQEGPPLNAGYPPGSFAEDYEYKAGSGDLDEFNGRFTKTPEYPEGTYAYFLTSTWPYLIGPRYFGEVELDAPARVRNHRSENVDLWTDRARINTGEAVQLTLAFHDSHGKAIRFLEKVHQQQVHLIVVSKDLGSFTHIHPEPVPGDALSVSHTFSQAGEYWVYADYTAPGEGPSVAKFALTVAGEPCRSNPPKPDTESTKTVGGIRIAFSAPEELKANRDLPLTFSLTNAENGQPIADLEPWLGAWGHIMIVSANGAEFIHAHPLGANVTHAHNAISGPSPSAITTITGFRAAGIYKIWLQFQRHGAIVTVPWVFKVADAGQPSPETKDLPTDMIRVTVSGSGFDPARLEIPAGKETEVAFTRSDAQNCANEIAFPELGIRKPLPPGQTVVVNLPAQPQGEMHFACGMGMFRGAIVVK